MMITALAWIFTSIIGGISFMLSFDKSFIDAVFETAGGLSTTGIFHIIKIFRSKYGFFTVWVKNSNPIVGRVEKSVVSLGEY